MNIDRVLFVGYLWPGSTCVPRLNGLRALGLDVDTFDATNWPESGGRVANALAHRTYATLGVREMNAALAESAARSKPDVVWLEKGNWVYPSTLRRMREHVRFLVHYNTDDVFGERGYFWLHRLGVKLYDVHLTTNRWNVRELRNKYGVRSLRVGMGYDQDLHRPPPATAEGRFPADVLFVGHWEPHTERFLTALREGGVSIRVFGHGWRRAKDRSLRVVRPLEHGEYVATIASAKLALCTLSRRNRNESTGRSFEIPAIGTCMLAERTAEHLFLYGEDDGAVMFSGKRELLEKTHRFLRDDDARDSIARAGHARCVDSGMSWRDHVRREWPLVVDTLLGGGAAGGEAADSPFWPGFRGGAPFAGEPRPVSVRDRLAG